MLAPSSSSTAWRRRGRRQPGIVGSPSRLGAAGARAVPRARYGGCYSAAMRQASVLLYELGAHPYAWATNQAGWAASCDALAARLPPTATTVLDLGCGPGAVLAAVARRLPGAVV